jgi:hypothetical protein
VVSARPAVVCKACCKALYGPVFVTEGGGTG